MSTSSGNNNNNSNNKSNKGIDIRQALEILSARSSEPHDHSHGETDSECCHSHNAPKEAVSMGQTIDLNQQPGAVAAVSGDKQGDAQDSAEMQAQRKALEEERAKRRVEIEEHMQSMSVKELIQAVMEAQQKRVTTYKEYDGGLDLVLKTNNMSDYPTVCAEATASFSVLSDTIKSIQKVLTAVVDELSTTTASTTTNQRKEVGGMLNALQTHEKLKLSLTAALHLDKIRASQQGQGDERTLTLLQKEVISLQGKIAACVQEINEVLEELRYVMVDEE